MGHQIYDLKNHKWVDVDEPYRDPNAGLNGPIDCPEQGYFDPVLNQRFETKNQKRNYMRANGLKMQSGSRPTEKPLSKYYFIPGIKNSRYHRYR